MHEVVKKRMVVGLSKRVEWAGKLSSVLKDLVGIVRPELGEDGHRGLERVPVVAADLICAGVLRSLMFEFAGEACELAFVYYPDGEDEDDLDLSGFRVVDWKGVDRLGVRLVVEDLDLAERVAGKAIERLSAGGLSVELEGPAPAATGAVDAETNDDADAGIEGQEDRNPADGGGKDGE